MRIMRTTIRMVESAILAIVILSVFPVAASGPPPVATIVCLGCNSIEQTSATDYTAFVRADAMITLSGNPGYQTYAWTQNGLRISSAQKITFKITLNTQYSLTVTDYGGIGGVARYNTRAVQINLVSSGPQNICVPDLADISVDSDYLNRIAFAVGEDVLFKTDYDKNQCANISFHWESNDPGVFIKNPTDIETRVVIKAKPLKNPTIKAIATNGISQSEKDATIIIVDNTAPTVKGKYTYTTLLSHTNFEVICRECWTGNGYNENSDFISQFTATLRDTGSRIISSGTATAKRGQTLSAITLKPGEEGKYLLEVTAKDSHGLSATVAEPIFVGFGNTEDDVPFIVANDTIFCDTGKPCSIDVSKTYTHNLGVRIRYDDITASSKPEPLYNIGGALCTTLNCTVTFRYQYAYKIRITMAYIRNGAVADRHSEKIVTVIVGEPGKTAPTATPQAVKPVSVPAKTFPTVKLTPQPPPEVPAKPTPGLSPIAILVVLIAAAMLPGGRNNKH